MTAQLGARLARGASADIHEFGAGRVVKLFKPQYALIAPTEAERTAAVYRAGLPCPEVFDVVTLDERTGIVMERIDGPTLLSDRSKGGEALAPLHLALHETAPDEVPHWRAVLGERAKDRFVAGAPDGSRLFHGDFHPGNVICSARGPVIVDWPNALRAHPAVDVARSIILMRYQGAGDRILDELASGRLVYAREYLYAYLDAGTVSPGDIQRAIPLHAAGLVRAEPENPYIDLLRELRDGAPDPDLEGYG